MKTQAYFENIQDKIIEELNKAEKSIFIAVAWFTDSELFNVVTGKVNDGLVCEMIIMDDEINKNSGINYDELVKLNGKLWKIDNVISGSNLMHNKFCIVDEKLVINGSYNWTRKAKSNHESITVISDSPEIALDFIEEFNSIKNKYFGTQKEKEVLDISKMIIRLDTLKNVVLLEDEEDIEYQLKKLKKIIKPSGLIKELNNIFEIIDFVANKRYGDAVFTINAFVAKYKQLSIYIDSEVFALKLEIKALELNISSLEDEKIDIEKLIHNFEIRYNEELGILLIEILNLRKEKLKAEAKKDKTKQSEYKEAEQDYDEFQKNYKITKREKIFTITEKEKTELKSKFRTASKMCHPDVVAEEHKSDAARIFNELKQAYDRNDLKKIIDILEKLEKGIFIFSAEKIDEKLQLRNIINRLQIIRDAIEKTVCELKNSETYKIISKITNWDKYFEETKNRLWEELKKFKNDESK